MSIFDDLNRVRAFVAIVESGSISAAARQLKLTQPTISRYLKSLESESGSILIFRNTHRMQLSGAGIQFLEDARAVLDLVEDAQHRLRQEQTELHGHIRIFTTIDIGQKIICELLSEFLAIHMHITAELCYSNRPVNMLDEACDLGIMVGQLTDDSIVAREIAQQHRLLCGSPAFLAIQDEITTPEHAKALPWLSVRNVHLGGQKVFMSNDSGQQAAFTINPIMSAEGVTALRQAALSGVGLALLPTWLVREDIASGQLVEVLPHWRVSSLPVHLIYPSQRLVPQRVRALMGYVIEHIQSRL